MTKTLVVAALLFGASSSVHAQPSPPAPAPTPVPAPTLTPAPGPVAPALTEEEKRAQAKALYEKGLSHYNLGEFDQAIAAFRKAYEISSAPGLLFNIAQSFRLKKDYEQAMYFYSTYLRLKPDAANRADVEARLDDMKKAIEEQKKMDTAPPRGTVNPDGTGSGGTQPAPSPVTVNVNTPERPAGPGNGPTLMTAGLATAGAGAALVVTGLVFGKLASSAESELDALNASGGVWDQAAQDTYDAGKRNNTIAVISFIAGGAAIATGGALYMLGSLKKKNASVAVIPTRTGTTVAVGWSF